MAQIIQGIAEKIQAATESITHELSASHLVPGTSITKVDDTPHGRYTFVGPLEISTPTSKLLHLEGETGHVTKYGPSANRLKLEITAFTSKIARIRLTDAEKQRWEIPQALVPIGEDLPASEADPSEADFDILLDTEDGKSGFAIVRKSDAVPVFDSRGLPISFCDHYIEISTQLPEETSVYGLGEVTGPFLRETPARFAFWARDAQTPLHENAYSSFPIFAGISKCKAFGVYLHNSNALDMVYEAGKITYKVVGGILDFFVFLGDSYADVTRQYQWVTGFPQLPPYYSLGYHQCRWFYDTTEKLHETRTKNMEANIPVDVFWLDIDYMIKYKLFTLDPIRYPDFAQYVKDEMHKNNHKLVAILDPGIKCNIEDYKPWKRGTELDIFIKNGNTGKDFVGKVWPGHVAFPDWIHPNVQRYWTEMMREWLQILPADGIWHDMNECSNFVNGDVWEAGGDAEEDEILIPTDEETVAEMAKAAADGIDVGDDDGKRGAAKPKPLLAFDSSKPFSITNPPYAVNHGAQDWPLSARSISVESKHYGGVTEYDIHNLFGHLNCKVTYNSLLEIRPDQRPFILTRAAFAGTGKYSSKWLGDNFSNWDSMKWSIAGMLNMQLYGVPHIGSDIGGFNGAPTTELLLRWFQLGSMYPFCRNHNMPTTPPQEAYISSEVAQIARNYLTIRYRILPFWYTAFAKANKFGGSVVQPVWAVYPPKVQSEAKKVVEENNDAFLINEKLLCVPVVTKGQTMVETWIPAGLWYEFETGELVATTTDEWMTLGAPIDKMPLFFRGGSVIPMHYNKSGKTTVDYRAGGFSLTIALDVDGTAQGDLYLDDGATYSSGKSWIAFAAKLSEDTKSLQIKISGEFGYKPEELEEITVKEVVLLMGSSRGNSIPTRIVLDCTTTVNLGL